LLSLGIKTICLSMGEEGAIFAEGDTFIQALPLKIDVLSTVGAGDAMVAGLIVGTLNGESLIERAKLATAFSTCALTKLGVGRTTRDRVLSVVGDIRVKEVKI